jgi:C4-dicarboxylate transporter DctQ subunit
LAEGRDRKDQRHKVATQRPFEARAACLPRLGTLSLHGEITVRPETSARILAGARWLRRRAENVAAFLLLAMFLCFILQIITRYVFNYPLGWTDEASVVCWIWCTLWGAAFILREKDEVRFDIIYSTASDKARCAFTVITGIATIALFGIALPAVIAYVTFLKVERTAYLGIRLDYVYSIYVLFSIGVIVRYAALTWRALHGQPPNIQIGSGSAL